MRSVNESLSRIESIQPHAATLSDIHEAKQLLKEIPESELLLRVKLLGRMASFFLESKALDLNTSNQEAEICYQKVIAIGKQTNNNEWLLIGYSGLANSLAREYGRLGDQEVFEQAKKMYEHNIETSEKFGMRESANSSRMNYATLLSNAKHGDRFMNNEKALNLLREVLENSSEKALGENFNSDTYGRTLYNLGAVLLKQAEEPHMRTIYINEAIDSFQKALRFRPAEKDPIGRVRILRALATIYHEWKGADSLNHAYELARKAKEEAIALELTADSEEKAVWAIAKENKSALNWSFDEIEYVARNRVGLIEHIKQHAYYTNNIPREQMPLLWADWVGGYGVLTGRVGVEDGDAKYINAAKNSFFYAIEVVKENNDPRLYMLLSRELGKLCHQTCDWEVSLNANKKAVEIGLSLTNNSGTDISRTNELESFTRAAHFAAFAAAQLNLGEEAAELAEMGRARWMDEAIIISSLRLSSLPSELKIKIDDVQATILELERQELELQNQGVSGMAKAIQNHFGIPLGEAIKMRLKEDADGVEAKRIKDLANVRSKIQELHEHLTHMLNAIEGDDVISKHPSYNQINEIVLKAGFPIIYLLTSTWGTSAIIVYKKVEILSMPELTRDQIQDLLYAKDGYINNITNNSEELEFALERIQNMLDWHIIPPIVSWCQRNEIQSIGIIGLGDIGMLPIQVSTVAVGLRIRLLPSVRSLLISQSHKIAPDSSPIRLLTVGDLNSNGQSPLKYSGIESRVFSDLFSSVEAYIYDDSYDLTLESIDTEINSATHIHFSCHGTFAQYSPLNSVLYLDGDEKLPVESLLRPALRLFGTELVILSACNSASVEHWRTPDETIGFPAAFLAAGAKTVIAAQWPVSDSATFLLMQQFCKELLKNNFNAARSLANSQLWLKKATKEELKVAINDIHDSFGNNEMRAKRLLKELEANIESLNNEYPFADRNFWAGFICVGA